ncbi:hypothetical protein B0T22DRAFT_487764 [Podospora appendiculata]|uniref:SRR1-like domain-containing protein n=1 Tax=Podospora appendiculata TaxID=314037 RepID=A0AAE0XJ23_9PEZI|nr:hypothetical protein B0T22DRAFT_487764 [Podospora appendiculata]
MTAQEGEWNQVVRKRGHLRHITSPSSSSSAPSSPNTKAKATCTLAEPLGIRPNPNPEFTVGDIRRHHDAVDQEWQASSCWQALKEILTAMSTSENRPVITRAICLGPGPYDPSNGSSTARRTAHMQTAAFRSIVGALEPQNGQPIKCIIQEPAFTETDKQFCAELGFDVAETPEAFSMGDANTLLFGIHMELRTYHQALGVLPAVFIGAGLDEWERVQDFDPEIRRLLGPISRMEATYNKRTFPDLNYMFSSTAVYWPRSGDAASSCP